ncbi:MAG TPA: alpha-L-arabinofuranosidase [Verrucomicrobiae bacterium]|nr:alpha-L-arabinofuranosidase [Verrucomicrobiae bacterium]
MCTVRLRWCLVRFFFVLILMAGAWRGSAQSPLLIYTDRLVNGFQDWSWASPRDLTNTSPVHSGSNSISATASAWQALSFWHADLNAAAYTNLSFWINGGSAGGQKLQVYAQYGTNFGATVQLSALPANTWQWIQVPLVKLAVASVTNLNRINLQLTAPGPSGTFYVDDMELTAKPAPLVHLSVDATKPLRNMDSRWFGVNTAVWDGNFDTSTTIALLRDMGTTIMRFPGGSLSDEYHWASNTTLTNTWRWSTSFGNFIDVATNIGSQAFITVNYGTGTPAEAAAWVQQANVTSHLGFKYWEIGNENYGTWETDTNSNPHDPYTYGMRAADYYRQMKAADPSIKVGVVATPGEDSASNGYTSHPALNPRTGQTHNGWVPVMLSTLKAQGVTPDFVVHHRYPEYTDPKNPTASDSDSALLQCSTAWFSDAAELRQEITDYLGAAGTNIELVCTENNNDSGAQGRQSTSLVNGLYYADSLAQLARTEFNAFVWWDLRNGTDTSGSFDSELYGWRTYGDLGMINGLSTRHPTFYAAKLMRRFIAPGGQIISAASDYLLLSAYAARAVNGAVSLLVLHKDPSTNFNAQIAINGFVPGPACVIQSYGIPQDEAARANAPLAAQDIATNSVAGVSASFNYTFPPLSISLFTFEPIAPTVEARPSTAPGGPLVLELHGQAGVQYVIQTATDLSSWKSVSTNTLSSDTAVFNFALMAGPRYWRAVWQP